MAQRAPYLMTVDELIRKLRTTKRGLSESAVLRRRASDGANILPSARRRGWWSVLGRQFSSPLIVILVAAAAVSYALDDRVDAHVILAAVVLNVVVGFIQEYRAERTIEALHRVVRYQALVLRDGVERLVASEDLVVGDLLRLRAGDRIVADARVMSATNLQVNEAVLTGEALPVEKIAKRLSGEETLADQRNMVFSGTTVVEGSGLAFVVATGVRTEFGRIITAVREAEEPPTPWQQRLNNFARFLTLLIGIVAIALFCLGMLTGRSFVEMFAVSVAIAVAAIPEGLAIGVTVVLVVGMRRILKRQALTRQLVAVETLGSTTVLCVDKTGTVTEGNMAVARVVTNNHDLEANPDALHAHAQDVAPSVSTLRLFRIGLLCNDAHIENEDASYEHRLITGSPTERALVLAAHAVGFTRTALEKEEPRLESLPFDSNRKYMLTVHRLKQGHMLYCKGAPEVVIGACRAIDRDGTAHPLDARRSAELLRRAEQLSREGLRVLAFAYAPVRSDELPEGQLPPLTFVGFVGLKDPLRPESAPAIARLQAAGIRVAMITGDHRLTAEAIARELGILSGRKTVVSGRDLATMTDEELQRRVADIAVYARVTAQDKIRIVKAWKARGEVVAMTGDGINDAAALKAADIGIALGSGTDVAKEASRLILLDDNVKTIAAAVEEGRIIFENVRKVTLYLLSDSFAAVLLVALSLIAGLPLALSAAQILWINLIADGLPNIALTVEPKERDVMREAPRSRKEPLVDTSGRRFIMAVSLFMGLFAFLIFAFVERASGDVVLAQSVTFLALGTTTLMYTFSLRNTFGTIFATNPFRNLWLCVAVAGGLGLQWIAVSWGPLQRFLGTSSRAWDYWPLVLIMVILVLTFVEATKLLLRPNQRKVH